MSYSTLSRATNEIVTDRFQIVVERLTKNINENHLTELFGSFGEIIDMDMPMNRQCKLCPLSIGRF